MGENVTDTGFNPSGLEHINELKADAQNLAGKIQRSCPDNHIRQLALDHLRIATMLAVQSNFEDQT